MRFNRIVRLALTLAVAALAACTIAACGSSDDSSTTTGGGKADAAGVATAQRELAPITKLPDSIGVSAPLEGSVRGKTIYYMECGVPECKLVADGLEEAAAPLGIEIKRVPAGNTPESIGRAFDQAVRERPDGVVASGVSRSLVGKQLARLHALEIPVVMQGTTDPPGDGISQVMEGPKTYLKGGRYAADWAIADSDGSANVLFVIAPVFEFNKAIAASFQSTLKRNCPDCSVHVMDVSADDIGKGVPGQIVSYLQQKPDTDYVMTAFGSLMIGVPQAVRAAGLSDEVTLFTLIPSQLDYKNIKAGVEKAAIAPSEAYLTWMTIDQMARAMTGQDPAKLVDDGDLPWWQLFDADNIDWDVDAEHSWPYFEGFRDQFKKLWGVS